MRYLLITAILLCQVAFASQWVPLGNDGHHYDASRVTKGKNSSGYDEVSGPTVWVKAPNGSVEKYFIGCQKRVYMKRFSVVAEDPAPDSFEELMVNTICAKKP